MKKMKTVTEYQIVETSKVGRERLYRMRNLETAFNHVEWYKTDRLERTVIVQTREVTTTPWVTVEKEE
jgi:hypothetical protein